VPYPNWARRRWFDPSDLHPQCGGLDYFGYTSK
jgi:hypothetical protein